MFKSGITAAAIVIPALFAGSALSAQSAMPKGKPFALRGVELGITIDAFRALPPIGSEGDTDLRTAYLGDPGTSLGRFDGATEEDRDRGIVSCQWFGRLHGMMNSTVFIDLGAGKVLPSFDFIESGGSKWLFRITSFANSQYYRAVRDALTRGYGAPKVVTAPFKTVGGGSFTQTISIWDNGLSDIMVMEPCRQLQRYCITYRHKALHKQYEALVEKSAAAAAEKL